VAQEVTSVLKWPLFPRSPGKKTTIVVHHSPCEALQAMEIIHLDPWASGVGTLATLTACSLAQDGNPRSAEFVVMPTGLLEPDP
jgi:hypothetical protein